MKPTCRSFATWLIVLFTAGASLAGDAEREKANKDELAKFQGKWKVVGFTKGGQQDLDELVKLGLLFTFKDDSLTVTADREGFTPQNQMLRLDATTTPKLLDFAESAKAFEEHKKVYEGVYSLDGDIMQWCFNLDGDQPAKANRPAAVESKADSGTILIKLERLKE
jgi:uncharacterized protein (TIGR03067 family)